LPSRARERGSSQPRIAKEAQESMDREIVEVPPFDPANLGLVLDITVTVLAGIAARRDSVDVDRLAA
jgi:hypothetical protein